ncbi:MarR family winged helix-turn-helix transcriptional regulator [Curtanaerobium respiraculi]|uniref:MarR family winged helix-turn-helix transcriptional regulator n=1 Tax=Curtanaerobium respiraculi TaxID=2949669 RepID=UPI0024B36DBE|nr:MarR family transcriptional regulator [Curtanaerobium respiraculi]
MAEMTETEEMLYGKVMELQFLLMPVRRGATSRMRPEQNPTEGQGRVIAFLKIKDGVSTRDLARVLGIGISGINDIISRMEKAGFVERRKSPEDGRVMLVWLTDAGRAVKQEAAEPPELFAGFSEEELSQLGDMLDRMVANLEDELGEGESFNVRWEQRAEALRDIFGEGFDDGRFGAGAPRGFGDPRGFGGMSGGFARGGFPGFGGEFAGRRRKKKDSE